MTLISERELRNDISAILRRAEAGERFTVAVDGRPVAELGPTTQRRGVTPERLREIFEDTPVDAGWAEDLRRMRHEDEEAAREREDA